MPLAIRKGAMSDDRFNEYSEALLVRYNRRNTSATTRHIESLCGFLRQEGNHVVQFMFGGSVQRRTYVTGLSDVDVLLIVNESSLVNRSPSEVIAYVRDSIQRRLRQNSVTSGNLAVTVNYSDGTEIQLLPAIRTRSGVRIAEPGSTGWSNVVQPERFAEKLTEVNQARGGRVIPTIKLAKAIADCHITRQDRKINGYHMESLAIDAFRNYQGALDTKATLDHLLTYSMTAVMKPIVDSTGQSRHVDEYLGPAQSKLREGARTHFGQMRGMVRNCVTRAQFNALFYL